MERLDKLLAATGRWSRKEAKALVKAGRVRVAGVLPQGPEDKVTPGTPVTVDGRLVATTTFTYLMLPKPAGVVSATEGSLTCAAGAFSPWGGWTRIRKACSYSPTTEGWPIGSSPRPTM